jgi:hypothetical protein
MQISESLSDISLVGSREESLDGFPPCNRAFAPLDMAL